MTTSLETGLRIDGLSKRYPGVTALDDVSLHIPPGTVHGLVGENGAGKSTLMKCVAGAETPDSGHVSVDGHLISGDVHAAARAGVAMIYQELTIVPELSALDNVFLGSLPSRFGICNRKEALRKYRDAAERIGASTPARARAGSLSTSSQQQLEIMRALIGDRRVLILDEPTASLGPADIESLHEVIRTLRNRGLAIVYVSHDLDAVLSVCDDVTVLREGQIVSSQPAQDWTTGKLVRAMVGDVPLASAGTERRPREQRPLFSIEGLQAPGVDVPQLHINRGEILGIAGLVGSGRTRLLRALAGADPVHKGTIGVGGTSTPWPKTPRQARRNGVLLAPEDRKHQGLVLDRPSAWNIALGGYGRTSRRGWITLGSITKWAAPYAHSVGFSATRLKAPAGTLSGGNQQKLLLARLLGQHASCILLDEPTRGIDVGAKAQIFETIRTLVDEGHSVIWSSSDLAEVAQHSDRIAVVAGGRLVAELPAGSTVQEILDHAFSARSTNDRAEGGSAKEGYAA